MDPTSAPSMLAPSSAPASLAPSPWVGANLHGRKPSVSHSGAELGAVDAGAEHAVSHPCAYGSFSPVRELPRHGREREPPGVAPADLAPYLSYRRAGERSKVQGKHADQHTHPPSRATREGTSHWPARRPANQQMQSDGRLRRIRLGLCAAGAYDGGGCAHAPYHSRACIASRELASKQRGSSLVSITITITNIFTITQKLDGHVARQCVNAMRRPDALGLVRRGIEIGRRIRARLEEVRS